MGKQVAHPACYLHLMMVMNTEIIDGSEQFGAVEQKCYGAVVDAGNVHILAE